MMVCPIGHDLTPIVLCLFPIVLFFTSKVFLKPDKPKDVYLRGPGFANIYAAVNQGQCKFCGVTKGGKKEFKRLVKVCKRARLKKDTGTFEQDFLDEYQRRNNIIAPTAEENRKAKRRKTNDEIAQESDDDDEDDQSLASESDSNSHDGSESGSEGGSKNDDEEEEEEEEEAPEE
jgi:hypothetical protein